MSTEPTRILLTDAMVISCRGGGEAPFDGDILIEGDRIAEVFRGRAPLPAGSVRTVDLAGATVLPGLCDAHTHISWPLDFVFDHPEIAAMAEDEHALEVAGVVRAFLRAGYTLLIGAGALKPRVDVIVQRAIDRGLIDGPRLWPSGAMITRTGTIGAGVLSEVADAEAMRRLVGQQCELGVRSIKLMMSGDGIVPGHPSQATYMDDAMVSASVEEAASHGAFVTAHCRGPESARMAVRNGIRIIHHASFLDAAAVDEITAARDDIWVCPGLHYLRAMVEGEAEPYGMTRERIEQSGYREELAASIEGLEQLHANGVRIVSGGDFGHQWTKHGTYAAELVSYVDLLGMSSMEALMTATAHAGPVVGERLGRIEQGYLADLVVMDGDPASDVGVLLELDRIGAVLKGGRPTGSIGWSGIEGWAEARAGTRLLI